MCICKRHKQNTTNLMELGLLMGTAWESRASFCLLPAGKIFNPMTFARRSGSCQASTYECVGGLRVQDIPSGM